MRDIPEVCVRNLYCSNVKGLLHISPDQTRAKKERNIIMQYTVRTSPDAKEVYKDRNGHSWPYLTPKQYKHLPRPEKRICGEMKKKDSGSLERTLKLDAEEGSQMIGLYEYRAKKKWNETIEGYIPAYYGEEELRSCCVRIVDISILKSILIPFVIFGMLAALILAYLWYEKRNEVPGLDEAAVAYKAEGLVNTDSDRTMIPILDDVVVQRDVGRAENVLINPEGNVCYFKFSLTLDDTGEVLYESGLVEPGTAIVGFDLDVIPEPGTYNVTLNVQTRDINDYEQALNGGEIKTTLIVRE